MPETYLYKGGSGRVVKLVNLELVRLEVDRDLGLDFDWVSIQIIGLVSPLADRFYRSRR